MHAVIFATCIQIWISAVIICVWGVNLTAIFFQEYNLESDFFSHLVALFCLQGQSKYSSDWSETEQIFNRTRLFVFYITARDML